MYSLLFDARGADVTALRASEVEILAWRVGQIRKSEGTRSLEDAEAVLSW